MKIRAAAVLLILLLASVAGAQTPPIEGTLKVPDAAQFVGQPKGTPLTGAELAARTNQVGSKVRCPVCQGLSVADSPSEMAVNMKEQVRELLSRGYTEEQILKYFELSYGQFVLLEPKFEGVNTLVWLLPGIALLIGGVIVFMKIRNLEQSPKTAAAAGPVAPEGSEPAPADPYLDRVREMVSGGKQ